MNYGWVYQIWSTKGDKVYVGSTCEGLRQRFNRHKDQFKTHDRPSSSKVLFEEYGVENCEIKLLETVEFTEETKGRLKEREEFWINSLSCVNVNRPTTFTPERAAESKKAYYEKNKDSEEFKERANDASKRYYAGHKETVLEKAAAYRAENPEKISEANRKQYEKLKLDEEKYKARVARQLVIVECECGAKVMRGNMPRHKKSAAHQGK